MSLTLVPRSVRALSDHINAYYRVLRGQDQDSVFLRLASGGGSFEVRHSATNAPVFKVTDTGATLAIGAEDIGPGAVTEPALASGAVSNRALAADAVTSDKIADGTIVNADIAANTINGDAKLLPSSVTGNSAASAIGANVIHANRIVAGSFDTLQVTTAFAPGSIASAQIADDTIVNADINAAAGIALSKVAHVGSGNVLRSTGSANVGGQVVNGDVSSSAGIVVSKLAAGGTANRVVATVDGTTMTMAQVADAMLASGISLAKLAPGSAGVLKSNGTVITAGNLITSADIQDGQIVNADISASAGIDGAKLLDNSIPATKLTGGASIPANSIDASHLIDGSIMNAEINAAAAIVVSKLAHVGAGNVLKSNGTSNVAGQVATADLAANAVSRVFFQNSGGAFSSGGTAGAWAATGNNLALTGLTIGSLVSVWYTGTAYHSAPPQGLNVGLSLDAAANVVATTFVSALAASAYSQLAFVGQFTASATTHTLLEVVNVSAATFTRAGNPSIMALEMKR